MPGASIEVTTYCPSGETCDMKPNLLLAGSPEKDCHFNTSSLRMDVSFLTGTRPYSPLSFAGPSTSNPSVLPSLEKEWQFAQVGRPCITILLLGSLTLRSRHEISGDRKSVV